jgi:hypothetical protein
MIGSMTHGNVVITSERGQKVALVVSEIQIHLTTVIRHIDLSVPDQSANGFGYSGGAETDSIGDIVPASMLI